MQFEHFIIVGLSIWITSLVWQRHKNVIRDWLTYQKERLPRQWCPKSPEDCPQCQECVTLSQSQINWNVQPYGEVKSRRGRKKSISTAGYACPNPACRYFGNTLEYVHALVSHGKRGKAHIFNTSDVKPVERRLAHAKDRCCTISKLMRIGLSFRCGFWPKASIGQSWYATQAMWMPP